jgi:hypothetical protein
VEKRKKGKAQQILISIIPGFLTNSAKRKQKRKWGGLWIREGKFKARLTKAEVKTQPA